MVTILYTRIRKNENLPSKNISRVEEEKDKFTGAAAGADAVVPAGAGR